MSKITFYWKPKCSTCREVKDYLEGKGHELDLRDLDEYPPPRSLLETHIDAKNVKAYLNTRSNAYREHGLKEDPPTKKGAIELMMRDPNLIKRPISVSGKIAVFGNDPEVLKELEQL
ncbi:MAG TPA: ArsC/Spx/MgsR family protein [Candidatus Sumerlaeota bacterium]|nr:ArsC/Spx/MgsR family protein [Candidatus Sumerlaeota bacterium]HMZ50859.1 ArsC/Spx/MgsR family protein [Candidatus Sumerlaeota bacterium]HNM46255.1 ArsC/Spx/MgsR family protein [Candidatus Sumerlaeota bacterium]